MFPGINENRTTKTAEADDGMSEDNVRKLNLNDCRVRYSPHYKHVRQKQHTDDFNH